MISSLGCAPVLLDKIKLTMVLGVEIALVATLLNELLELWALVYEIRLKKEDTPAAAIHTARGALEFVALGRQAPFWPQPTFKNNLLHALEPAGHGWVVIWKIK